MSVHRTLIDIWSEICCISEQLVRGLNTPIVEQVKLSGLQGRASVVNVMKQQVKLAVPDENHVNIVLAVTVWFAVVPGLNEQAIITPTVANLLEQAKCFDICL